MARSESIKDSLPADLESDLRSIRMEINADGTWNGVSPQGKVGGTWSMDGDVVVLAAAAGEPLRGTFNATYLVLSVPGLPMGVVLERD